MTVSLIEVSSLIGELQSIMDDSGRIIQGIYIGRNTFVQMEPTEFLIEFMEYEIKVDDDERYSFVLKSSISGVQFITVMSTAEIVELKESIPDQWEYIQRKVQQ